MAGDCCAAGFQSSLCRSWVKIGLRGGVRRCMTAFPPKADVEPRSYDVANVPLAAVSNRSKQYLYSITSSAMARSDGDTVRPSIRAVSVLMTSSNLVACTTGKSAGFSPLRMRPA